MLFACLKIGKLKVFRDAGKTLEISQINSNSTFLQKISNFSISVSKYILQEGSNQRQYNKSIRQYKLLSGPIPFSFTIDVYMLDIYGFTESNIDRSKSPLSSFIIHCHIYVSKSMKEQQTGTHFTQKFLWISITLSCLFFLFINNFYNQSLLGSIVIDWGIYQ